MISGAGKTSTENCFNGAAFHSIKQADFSYYLPSPAISFTENTSIPIFDLFAQDQADTEPLSSYEHSIIWP